MVVVVGLAGLACRSRGLGWGPPKVGRSAVVLETFDPAALAKPGADGLQLGAVPRVEREDPAVRSHGPTAEASRDAKIELRFNRPMVRFGAGQVAPVEPSLFTLDPPVPGRAYWGSPLELVFEPEGELAPATTYTVRVDARLPCVDGPDLDLRRDWQFTTTRPSVNLRVADYPQRLLDERREYHHRSAVEIEASQPVEQQALAEAISVEVFDEAGHARSFDAVSLVRKSPDDEPPTRFELRPSKPWPADHEVVVSVAQTLVGTLGPATMADTVRFGFHTVPGVVVDELVCTERRYEDGCALGPVGLALSSPVSARQARHVSVSPRPRDFKVVPSDRVEANGQTPPGYRSLIMWGRFERDVEYELRVAPALRDALGQPLAPRGGHRELLRFVDPEPSLELIEDSSVTTLDLSRGATLGVETRHVAALELTAAILSDEEHEQILAPDFDPSGFPSGFETVIHERIPLTIGPHGWSSHALDLSRLTDGKPGIVAYRIGPAALTTQGQGRTLPKSEVGLSQLTRLGVSVISSIPGSVVRVARLDDDAPVAGASVELIEAPGEQPRVIARTDADGRATLPSSTTFGDLALVRVRAGDDRVVLTIGELDRGPPAEDGALLRAWEWGHGTMTTDRPLYMPGERVRVIGWGSLASPHVLSGLLPLPPETKVLLQLRDPHREVIATRTVTAKEHGKYWATLELPPTSAVGSYQAEAWFLGHMAQAHFRVHDTQLPDFELHARAAEPELAAGEAPSIQLTASYLFGGRVPIVGGRHTTTCEGFPYPFRPPKLPEEFEVARAWSDRDEPAFESGSLSPGPGSKQGRLSYTLGPAPSVGRPLRCTHAIAVADASAREVGAELEFRVMPPVVLAAAGPEERGFGELEPGDDAIVELRAVHIDGSPARLDGVEVRPERDPWGDPQPLRPCRTRIVDGEGRCRFRALKPGYYGAEVRAMIGGEEATTYVAFDVRDPRSESEFEPEPEPPLELRVEGLDLVDVGATIDVGVRTRWPRGRALLVMGKGGLHELRELSLVDGEATASFEVEDGWIPEVEFNVLAVEPGPAPTAHWDSSELKVSAASRKLEVELELPGVAQTGERVPIAVSVRDAAGRPATGHVAVWAIDEAVLALAPFNRPSIVDDFADTITPSIGHADGYDALIPAYSPRPDPYSPRVFDPRWASPLISLGNTGLIGHGHGGGGRVGRAKVTGFDPSEVRSEFSSAPFFVADARLDASGRARVEGQLPDNLTTFRVIAIATSPISGGTVEARAGIGEARILVTRPLAARALVPRALRPGDRAELGILVDNLEGPAGTIEVEVELSGDVVTLLGSASARATIEAGGQVRVPFAIAAAHAGEGQLEARVRLTTGAGQVAARDAVRVPLPVQPERTLTERVAVYGELDDEAAVALLPIALPADADPGHGGLSVSIGATLLGGLEDALAYLIDYPYGCAEQTLSRLVPVVEIAALERADMPALPDADEQLAAAVGRLRSMQLDSGAFASWPGGTQASPMATAYASWVLQRARRAGLPIPDELLEGARDYTDLYLQYWALRRAPALRFDIYAAYMLWSGGGPEGALSLLFERRARLPVFARAMLLSAILRRDRSDERGQHIAALVAELRDTVVWQGPRAAVVSEGQPWTRYWDSDTRSSALLLLALLDYDAHDRLVTPLVRGLLDARRGGRWANTQENALALAALSSYAAKREAAEPDFEARIWLGQRALARIDVEGRATAFEHGFTPMAKLSPGGSAGRETELVLERAGTGTLYYRVGLEWASTADELPALAAGVGVARQLRDAEGPIGEGEGVSVGTLLAIDVRVELEASVDDLAIEVPIAAGLEPVDLALGHGRAAMKIGGEIGDWVSHQEARRDRVVVFADHLEAGTYETTAFVRATTPGEFLMPAATAEMMYYPEIHGRSASRQLTVANR